MQYIKGDAYYAQTTDKNRQYPYLNSDISCELVIIGGGIDGAIANYYLSQKHEVVLVDKNRLAHGCTSCATPLCEYQLDKLASQMPSDMCDNTIVSIYRMGIQGIDKLSQLVDKLGNSCNFARCPTLLYSDKSVNAKLIEQEYMFRTQHGFDCQLWDSDNNAMPFPIDKGLYCPDGGCTFHPYKLAGKLIEGATNQSHIYENTQIDSIENTDNGLVLTTNFGNTIRCQKVVVATGFNWEVLGVDNLCKRFVTYSIVTEPIAELVWHNNTLCQDDGDPYHYFKVLPDNRIIFGGQDTPWTGEISQGKADKLYDKLEAKLRKLLPQHSHNIRVQYRFCGAYGTTDNNLGVIGASSIDGLYYFISCGANGIVNAVNGVDILEDIMQGNSNDMIRLFDPNR